MRRRTVLQAAERRLSGSAASQWAAKKCSMLSSHGHLAMSTGTLCGFVVSGGAWCTDASQGSQMVRCGGRIHLWLAETSNRCEASFQSLVPATIICLWLARHAIWSGLEQAHLRRLQDQSGGLAHRQGFGGFALPSQTHPRPRTAGPCRDS